MRRDELGWNGTNRGGTADGTVLGNMGWDRGRGGVGWGWGVGIGLCQTFAKVFSKVAVVRRKAKKSKKVATFLGGRAKVAGGARAEGYKFVRARKFLRF